MTWKEIKDKIESEGVQDNSIINWIDISLDINEAKDIECIKTHGHWEISN